MCNIKISELVIPASVEVLESYSISGNNKCKKLIFAAGSKLKKIYTYWIMKYVKVLSKNWHLLTNDSEFCILYSNAYK